MGSHTKLLILFSYLSIYLIWGSTYFFTKLAVWDFSVPYVMLFRYLTGTIIMLGISIIKKEIFRLPDKREILSAIFIASFLMLGGNGLVTLGEVYVDSYIAALIISLVPFIIAFFNKVFYKIDLSLFKALGVLTGIAGVGFILYNGQSLGGSLWSPGVLIILAAATLWSFGTSTGHRLKVYPGIFFQVAMQMLFVSVISFIFILLNDIPVSTRSHDLSMISIISVFYLGIIGSLALVAYNYLLKNEPSIRISSYSMVNPVIATLLGVFAGGEVLRPLFFLGLPLILIGLFLLLYADVIFPGRINK
ncbi:MAG: EamA family transporter [Spirochaetales bacterium]|nr:EamA family transporter [Spirochaetales bacterium]